MSEACESTDYEVEKLKEDVNEDWKHHLEYFDEAPDDLDWAYYAGVSKVEDDLYKIMLHLADEFGEDRLVGALRKAKWIPDEQEVSDDLDVAILDAMVAVDRSPEEQERLEKLMGISIFSGILGDFLSTVEADELETVLDRLESIDDEASHVDIDEFISQVEDGPEGDARDDDA